MNNFPGQAAVSEVEQEGGRGIKIVEEPKPKKKERRQFSLLLEHSLYLELG